jgi:hypothetical protein
MAKLTNPIPQDKIGENFVWRDWLQRLSDRVYGTLAAQDANNVAITGGAINNTTIGATTPSTGHFTSVLSDRPIPTTAPVVKTADFTVAATDMWLINNKSGSTCSVTLPIPNTNIGRVLSFQNYQTQTVVSTTSNVVPLVGGAASTAILNAVAGDSCLLVSDGTNWVMTQYTPNNVLLLE